MDTQPISTEQPIANPDPMTSPVLTLAPKSSHLVSIILSVLITTIVLVGGYFLFTNYSQEKQGLSPSPTPALSDMENSIEGWQTYTNDEFNFSLKYPLFAKTSTRDPDPFPIAIQIDNLQPRVGGGGGPEVEGWLITISEPQPNPQKLSLSDWGKSKDLTKNMDYNTGIVSSITPTETQLAEYPAIMWRGPETFRYYILQKNDIENIFILVNEGESTESINKTIDQILSTFKFTNI